ncbi:MAG TPA: hypothetical protein VID24_12950 [Candidatus Eremiobacteraceae bacterium]
MFAAFLAAGLLLDSAAPSSSSQALLPLREIVYKFSEDLTTEYTTDQTSTGYTTTQSTNGLAAPPESSTHTSGFSGKLTVDVLEVDPDGFLKADVKETTDAENGRVPFEAVFIVRPDGNLVKVSGTQDAGMTSLIAYFGTQYFADRKLAPGQQWTTEMAYGKVQYETTTSVTRTSGDDVSMKSTAKAVKGVGNGSLTVQASIVYRASKLVPVSLDVLQLRQGSGDTSAAEQTAHFHFDRVSDSLDKPTGQ